MLLHIKEYIQNENTLQSRQDRDNALRLLLHRYPAGAARSAVAEAGVSYYDKMEARGKLMRELTSRGDWYFAESGRLASWVEEPLEFEELRKPLREALEGRLKPKSEGWLDEAFKAVNLGAK